MIFVLKLSVRREKEFYVVPYRVTILSCRARCSIFHLVKEFLSTPSVRKRVQTRDYWLLLTRESAAILPLLPAKQRMTHQNDWMSTDAEVACPDPHCKSRLRITRTGIRTFKHSDTTAVLLKEPQT